MKYNCTTVQSRDCILACHAFGADLGLNMSLLQNPQTGQTVQGYYITAYRNLTTVSLTILCAVLCMHSTY